MAVLEVYMMDEYKTGNKKLDDKIQAAFKKDPLKPTRLERIIIEDEWKENKYNVSEISERTYKDGTVFASKREMERWDYLLKMEQAGEISGLEKQVVFELAEGFNDDQYGDIKPIKYVADFVYENISMRKIHEGKICVEDVKGMKTSEYKLKRKLFLHRFSNVLFFEE